MEVDYKALFNFMLRSGLCGESDRYKAKELVDDWLNIYKETTDPEGEYLDDQTFRCFCCT